MLPVKRSSSDFSSIVPPSARASIATLCRAAGCIETAPTGERLLFRFKNTAFAERISFFADSAAVETKTPGTAESSTLVSRYTYD